jgi:hypothetical protein
MQTGFSYQHREIGSVALRVLAIAAVISLIVAVYLLRMPPGDGAPSSAQAMTVVVHPALLPEPSNALDAASAQSDAATTAHELLDPVGAGHDVAR